MCVCAYVCLCVYNTHTHTHTHTQNGCTALLLACNYGREPAAAELMEATKRAGALDLQVGDEAEGEQGGGEGRGSKRGGRRVGGRRALTCACACLLTGRLQPVRL